MCYNGRMDVSVIIPVYNSAKFLGSCLKSVIRAVKKYEGASEVLLVDNGSSDNSLEIMQECAKEYPKIVRTFDCATPGAGAARNFGAAKARGEYIWFVDADDTIEADALVQLMGAAEKGVGVDDGSSKTDKATAEASEASLPADLVMTGMVRHYEDGHTDVLTAVLPTEPDWQSRFVRYGMGPVQVLIRREWWKAHRLKFYEGIIHEDMELMSALILDASTYAAVEKPVYHYYQNPGSVLHRAEFDPHIFDIFIALSSLYKKFEQHSSVSRYRDELEWFFVWNLLIDSAKDFTRFSEGREGLRRSREMINKYFPDWRKNRFLSQKPLRLRLKVLLNYYLISCFCK